MWEVKFVYIFVYEMGKRIMYFILKKKKKNVDIISFLLENFKMIKLIGNDVCVLMI